MHRWSDMLEEPSAVVGFARALVVHAGHVTLRGALTEPPEAIGLVVFAHGCSTRRDQSVSRALVHAGFATLLFDLLTAAEESTEHYSRHRASDVALLADRLVGALAWTTGQRELAHLPIGLFASNAGAAAALIAATRVPEIGAIVVRGGRPDLANLALPLVRCPTLLLVGGHDTEVLELNHRALRRLTAPARLHVIGDAGHLFDEPGALDEVARCACAWFRDHLTARTGMRSDPTAPAPTG